MNKQRGDMRGTSRDGFTLVELLVVISIIGMLTAIAVPTIFSAVASARNAKTKAEIDMLQMALMNYKNEYGSFPPANMGPTNPATGYGPLWLTPTTNPARPTPQVNTAHPAYKHLVRIFPRLSEETTGLNSPYYTMSRMSPAQALVFWLQGFYENPEYPLTNGGPGFSYYSPQPGTRKRLFDFDESRLYAASMPYEFGLNPATSQTFSSRSSSIPSTEEKACPVYFTGHPSAGLPYAYFDSRCYDREPGMDVCYAATNVITGDSSRAFPYITATPPASPTWGQAHTAGETFQLIAAGKDGSYGTIQAAFPKSVGTRYSITYSGTTYPFFYADDKTNAGGHPDNVVNFADRALADAIEALKTQ
jgi:prepilin-type N-terminal cleavage/methylation domain-containing protein